MTRVPEQESIMGSAEDQRRSASCRHVWIGWPAVLFGYMPVDWRCVRCWTWAADPEPAPVHRPRREELRLWAFSMVMALYRLCGAHAPEGHGDTIGGAKEGCLCRWCAARRVAEYAPDGVDLLDPEVVA